MSHPCDKAESDAVGLVCSSGGATLRPRSVPRSSHRI